MCGTAIFSFTRFFRGSSTRESCQVGESFGGLRGLQEQRSMMSRTHSTRHKLRHKRSLWQSRFWNAKVLSNEPRNGCSSWKQKELPNSLHWSKAEHVLSGWRQKQQASCQCRQPLPSWKRKFPVFDQSWPPRTAPPAATRRPTCEEATIARRFCPQHSRGGGVVVEVQATGDGRCNIVGQHSGRRKIGNSDWGGSSPVAGVDSNPLRR